MALCQICGRPNSDEAKYCFGCGTTLTPRNLPPPKVDVKSPLTYPTTPYSPPSFGPSRQVPRPGSCYYHPDLPASIVCSRCGRSVCVGCTRQYGVLSFCTECFWGLAPKIGYAGEQYWYGYPDQGRHLF